MVYGNIPVYELIFEEGELDPFFNKRMDDSSRVGVDRISIVENPANMSSFIAMKSHKIERVCYSSDEKMMIYGAVLIPDQLIYRYDETFGEYYNVMSADTIAKIALQFAKDGNARNVNLEHTNRMISATICESWIVEDSNMDKTIALGLPKMKKGTWVIGTKIDSRYDWENIIKSGKVSGYSIEGIFTSIHTNRFESMSEQKNKPLSIKERAEQILFGKKKKGVAFNAKRIKLKDGNTIIRNGSNFVLFNEKQKQVYTLADGTYEISGGGSVEVSAGEVRLLSPIPSPNVVTENGEMAYYDAEHELLFMIQSEGSPAEPVKEGTFVLDNGDVIKVSDYVAILEQSGGTVSNGTELEAMMSLLESLAMRLDALEQAGAVTQSEVTEMKKVLQTSIIKTPDNPKAQTQSNVNMGGQRVQMRDANGNVLSKANVDALTEIQRIKEERRK